MLIAGMGVVVVGASVAVLVLSRRWKSRGGRVVARPVAIVGLALVCAVLGVYVWALSSTDSSPMARAIAWGTSSNGDQNLFPAATMEASNDPLVLEPSDGGEVHEAANAVLGAPFEAKLGASDTTAFLVIQGTQLVYEGYFNGSDRQDLQSSFSVAKSSIATLVGIAIDEGMILGLNDPVTMYVPELVDRDERFEEITLHHLITMSSGLSFEGGTPPWADSANTYCATDLRSAVKEIPVIETRPNTEFDYGDWDVVLLGLVLERATQMSLTEYTESRLWVPMGAEYGGSWSLNSVDSRFEKMFVGVNGAAIDFAKLGWPYLNEGKLRDNQILSPGFIEAATRLDSTSDPALEYQYLWWVHEGEDAYFANGDHGQYIYVAPDADIVIVRHGYSPGDIDWVEFMAALVSRLGA
jgi:CubicO group peptidase (beta-lactamase class C family)